MKIAEGSEILIRQGATNVQQRLWPYMKLRLNFVFMIKNDSPAIKLCDNSSAIVWTQANGQRRKF
jgi:hypothetical protein